MANKPIPSPELLSKFLSYNPETGDLTWIAQKSTYIDVGARSIETTAWNERHAGKAAFNAAYGEGYEKGSFFGHHLYAHRVAYAIYHGEWPDNIDHINGDRTDNRIKNLRSVTRSANNKNRALFKINTSGVSGVGWHKATRKWRARIIVHSKEKHLGSFKEFSEAVDARLAAEKQYGYHANHGRSH